VQQFEHARLGLTQLRGGAPIRDVGDVDDRALDRVVGDHRPDARVEAAEILRSIAQLHVDGFTGLEHPLQGQAQDFTVLGLGQFVDAPAHHLVTGQRIHAAVQELHAPVGIDEIQPVAGAGGHHLQHFLRLPQGFLCAGLLGDVHGHAHDAHDLAGGIAYHAG
jgi:hypothetical protein